MCGLVKGAQGIEIHQSKPLGRLSLSLEVVSDLMIIIFPLELRQLFSISLRVVDLNRFRNLAIFENDKTFIV